MRKIIFLNALLLLTVLSSCSDDDTQELIDFTVTFSSASINLAEGDTDKEITLTFSRAASEPGTIKVAFSGENAEYGTDFTTSPAADSGTISIPVAVGDASSTITFTKLQNPIEGTTKSVTFSIENLDNADWTTGTTASSEVNFTPARAQSGIVDSENGGSNFPNQVYVDLSTGLQTVVQRDTWEIAFYNGAENRVFLNAALLVSAAELTGVTDLLSVTESTAFAEPWELYTLNLSTFQSEPVTVSTVGELLVGLPIGYSQFGNMDEGIAFTDDLEGSLDGTAFSEVSLVPEENFVYIVGLGNDIPTDPAETGSISTTGDHRGFMKVRILSDGNGYTIQFAPLDETTEFTEITIPKDNSYALTAFSLSDGQAVQVEPAGSDWDLNITGVFSHYGDLGGTLAGLTYSDYVIHNTLGDVGLYEVITYEEDSEGGITELDVPSYTDFGMDDVDEAALAYDNRAVVGSGWRDAFGEMINDDRYYVVKDADGNYYKLLFTAYTSTEGERGNIQFTYERL